MKSLLSLSASSLLGIGLVLLAGCSHTVLLEPPSEAPPLNSPTPAQALDGTSWDYQGGRVDFSQGQISANLGCNNLFGSYEADAEEGSMEIELSGSTLMGCPEEAMARDDNFSRDTALITSYAREGDDLILSGEGITMTLTPPQDIALEGTTWSVVSLLVRNNGFGARVSTILDEGTFIRMESGRLEVVTACNQGSAEYTLEGNGALSLTDFAMTERACEEDAMQREQELLTSLRQSRSYLIDRENLDLLDEAGEIVASFRAEEG